MHDSRYGLWNGMQPAAAGLVRVIRLLCGEEEEALLVVGSAQQGRLPGHIPSALCGGQRALGLDALLGDALVQGYTQETLCVLDLAQNAGHPVGDQIHHLQHVAVLSCKRRALMHACSLACTDWAHALSA